MMLYIKNDSPPFSRESFFHLNQRPQHTIHSREEAWMSADYCRHHEFGSGALT